MGTEVACRPVGLVEFPALLLLAGLGSCADPDPGGCQRPWVLLLARPSQPQIVCLFAGTL
eukprot:1353261-Rhodomonas_salina.1